MIEDLLKNNKLFVICAIIMVFLIGGAVSVYTKMLKNTTVIDQLEELTHVNASFQSGEQSSIYVHISGAVKKPGVYRVPPMSRVINVVELAGGFTFNNFSDEINLAETVKDGQKIVIPFVKNKLFEQIGKTIPSKGLININTADIESLDSLPGIGPSTAKRIIEYREQNGLFKKKEELQNVGGIGKSKFEKIEKLICID